MGVFLNGVSALYRAFVKGEADPLAELEVFSMRTMRYGSGSGWRGGSAGASGYWKEALAGSVPEVLELPADHARPGQVDYAGEFVGLGFGEGTDGGIKGVELDLRDDAVYDVVGGVGGAFFQVCGPRDIVIGTPVARSRVGGEDLVGFFAEHAGLASIE